MKDFDLDIETVRYDDVPKMDEVCDKLQTYDMLVIDLVIVMILIIQIIISIK